MLSAHLGKILAQQNIMCLQFPKRAPALTLQLIPPAEKQMWVFSSKTLICTSLLAWM